MKTNKRTIVGIAILAASLATVGCSTGKKETPVIRKNTFLSVESNQPYHRYSCGNESALFDPVDGSCYLDVKNSSCPTGYSIKGSKDCYRPAEVILTCGYGRKYDVGTVTCISTIEQEVGKIR